MNLAQTHADEFHFASSRRAPAPHATQLRLKLHFESSPVISSRFHRPTHTSRVAQSSARDTAVCRIVHYVLYEGKKTVWAPRCTVSGGRVTEVESLRHHHHQVEANHSAAVAAFHRRYLVEECRRHTTPPAPWRPVDTPHSGMQMRQTRADFT